MLRELFKHKGLVKGAGLALALVERRCAGLLLANRAALDRLTARLLEHETVNGEVVDACLAV